VLDEKKTGAGTMTTLAGALDDMNSLDKPGVIAPVLASIQANAGKLHVELKPYSINVIRIKIK